MPSHGMAIGNEKKLPPRAARWREIKNSLISFPPPHLTKPTRCTTKTHKYRPTAHSSSTKKTIFAKINECPLVAQK